jgi:hypothetical protein
MHGLPELKIPNDWKLRTRVFVTRAKRQRPGLTPLVPREVYDAERQPSRDDDQARDQVRRDRFIHVRQ